MADNAHSIGRRKDFVRAVLSELRRVVEQERAFWTVQTHLPVVPHAAQLSLLAVLLLKGVDSGSDDDTRTDYAELEALLEKAYRSAKSIWAAAMAEKNLEARYKLLNDSKAIRAAAMKAVTCAEHAFGLHDMAPKGFTDDVQDALAELVGKVSEAVELKLAAGKSGVVPAAVQASIGLGSLAGGLAGRRVMTAKEASAARALSRLGAMKDETGGPDQKPVKKLRKALKELAQHLPEQRA